MNDRGLALAFTIGFAVAIALVQAAVLLLLLVGCATTENRDPGSFCPRLEHWWVFLPAAIAPVLLCLALGSRAVRARSAEGAMGLGVVSLVGAGVLDALLIAWL
jgi:hypothetical protein